jgi:hypothetical protein
LYYIIHQNCLYCQIESWLYLVTTSNRYFSDCILLNDHVHKSIILMNFKDLIYKKLNSGFFSINLKKSSFYFYYNSIYNRLKLKWNFSLSYALFYLSEMGLTSYLLLLASYFFFHSSFLMSHVWLYWKIQITAS